MIFLAVTMGYFAETIREGISDNQRAGNISDHLLKICDGIPALFATLVAFDHNENGEVEYALPPVITAIEKDPQVHRMSCTNHKKFFIQ